MSLSLPLYAVETELTEQKKAYCMNWADRFLSIKDGQHYRENKISAAKFPKYVDLCLEHYIELRNMYKKKNQANSIPLSLTFIINLIDFKVISSLNDFFCGLDGFSEFSFLPNH